MTQYVHSFDKSGYFTGSAELPPGASGANPEVATLDPLPVYDVLTEQPRRVAGVWVVEPLPVVDPEDGPGPVPHVPQYPRYFGNAKLDLFTPEEQLAVVTATMTDPWVKLMYDRLLGAAFLTYEDPEVEQGLALLVDKGLLTQDRKLAIVSQMQPV